jgi:hypothetical protein
MTQGMPVTGAAATHGRAGQFGYDTMTLVGPGTWPAARAAAHAAATAADLVAAGVHGFRRFAIERPHLFRLTFERLPPDFIENPTVFATLTEAYEALAGWIRRAQEAGVVDDRPVPELAFIFHSTCQGLATNELLRRPPPDGSGMWANTHRADPVDLWEHALHALVRGLAPTSTSRSLRRGAARR